MPFTVHVENFQSLSDVTVAVDGFTVVTGTNNTGKSSLMRAIRGAFQNARGTGYIRHGQTKSVVEITFDDGRKLRWEKGKAAGDKPTYIIDNGKPIHPGQAVPDEVRALGIKPIMVGDREIWPQFAPQFTGQIFLLDQPGSVLAEAVSDVNHVAQLNEALRFAESDKRSAAAKLKIRLNDKDSLTDAVKRYDGLNDVDAEIVAIEASHAKTVKIGNVIQAVAVLKTKLGNAQDAVAKLDGVEGIEIPDSKAAGDLLDELESLVKLQGRMRIAKSAVDKLTGIPDMEDLDSTEAMDLWDSLQANMDLRDRLVAAQSGVSFIEGQAVESNEKFTTVIQEIDSALGDLGECPTCGTIHTGGHS